MVGPFRYNCLESIHTVNVINSFRLVGFLFLFLLFVLIAAQLCTDLLFFVP